MSIYADLAQNVIEGAESHVREQVEALLAQGEDPIEIINQGLISGMNVVGTRFKAGDMYVPEVLMSARAMSSGIEIVRPLIADTDMPSLGKVILGTVKGDLHDIGKNLVGMLLESSGFTVINLGVDIPPEQFVQAVKDQNPNIVALSALLTTTMTAMKETIELLEEEGLRGKLKVIVGGAPVTPEFADEIGADGYAPDAGSAADLCRKMLS